MPSPTYTLIASTTLTGSQANVTFSSIPSTYTDLVLRGSTRGASASLWAGGVRVAFETSNSFTYSMTSLSANGTAAASSGAPNRTGYNGFVIANDTTDTYQSDSAGNTANTFSNFEIYIPNYLSTSNKPVGSFLVGEDNATLARMTLLAGLKQSTSAVNTIYVINDNGNWVSGSSFYLYGIKNV